MNLASFHLRNMIQLWYLEFLIETFIQKSQKIENNDNKYFFFHFLHISQKPKILAPFSVQK